MLAACRHGRAAWTTVHFLKAHAPMAGLLTGVRILLVDDDQDALELCVMLFSKEGAAVVAVGNARAAYGLACAGDFDILVSDIAMPEEDGYWLIGQIRALDSRMCAIPAVALS